MPAGLDSCSPQRRHRTASHSHADRHIEISATITEAVAKALTNAKSLPKEALDRSLVAPRDIAGARFVPQSDARIVQRYRLAA